ncbi:hypothetical protein HU200_011497 [Digitaria exilis]|uniref:F-box domain-containing protein n=1 Tax=Digitaria exilis TaxID=1010633 RepID=A0A835FHS2_9POAL|nr:hypothetical protein HU200_011497 [Digitaria exilis]
MAQLLPDDVLADILGRLPPRSLALSRCACRAWRNVVDSRDMLCADLLLPHALGGIFYNLKDAAPSSRFLAHPSVRDAIPGFLDDYTHEDEVHGHCNGLLLLKDSVANPATQQWASLPPRPSLYMGNKYYATCGSHLVYDPAVSPHYQVVSIPYDNPCKSKQELDPTREKSVEWPPSPLRLLVFSSRTGQWEEMPFLREGDPTWAAVASIPSGFQVDQCYAVYWQQQLYAYWKADSIMRYTRSSWFILI